MYVGARTEEAAQSQSQETIRQPTAPLLLATCHDIAPAALFLLVKSRKGDPGVQRSPAREDSVRVDRENDPIAALRYALLPLQDYLSRRACRSCRASILHLVQSLPEELLRCVEVDASVSRPALVGVIVISLLMLHPGVTRLPPCRISNVEAVLLVYADSLRLPELFEEGPNPDIWLAVVVLGRRSKDTDWDSDCLGIIVERSTDERHLRLEILVGLRVRSVVLIADEDDGVASTMVLDEAALYLAFRIPPVPIRR